MYFIVWRLTLYLKKKKISSLKCEQQCLFSVRSSNINVYYTYDTLLFSSGATLRETHLKLSLFVRFSPSKLYVKLRDGYYSAIK